MTKIISSVLLSILLLFACSNPATEPLMMEEEPPTPSPTIFSYLALGDSYTIGQGIDALDSWPYQLQTAISSEALLINEVKIIAKTGWTTTNLLNAIALEAPTNHDLVSLLIGVNNQYQGLSFTNFQTEFDSLLSIAINLAPSKERVFVVSIPDYGVTPFGANNSTEIAMELDNYNQYMESQCIDLDIPFINITTISRDLGSGNDALAPDNLHPSKYQYSLWVEEMLPSVKILLE